MSCVEKRHRSDDEKMVPVEAESSSPSRRFWSSLCAQEKDESVREKRKTWLVKWLLTKSCKLALSSITDQLLVSREKEKPTRTETSSTRLKRGGTGPRMRQTAAMRKYYVAISSSTETRCGEKL